MGWIITGANRCSVKVMATVSTSQSARLIPVDVRAAPIRPICIERRENARIALDVQEEWVRAVQVDGYARTDRNPFEIVSGNRVGEGVTQVVGVGVGHDLSVSTPSVA